jgi:hypothetical protein
MMSRLTAELATAGAAVAFGLTIAFGATEFGTGWGASGPEPGTFPFYIGLIIAAAGVGTMGQALAARRALQVQFLSAAQLAEVLKFSVPILAYVVLCLVLGIYVATAIYMAATLRFQNGYSIAATLTIALALPVFLFVVLEYGFSVTLMKGPIEAWFGL